MIDLNKENCGHGLKFDKPGCAVVILQLQYQ